MDKKISQLKLFKNGIILNVGAGNKNIRDSIPLDYPEWNADKDKIPYADESIVGIHCYHFLSMLNIQPKFFKNFKEFLCQAVLPTLWFPIIHHKCNIKTLITKIISVKRHGKYYSKILIMTKMVLNGNLKLVLM